MIVRIWTGVALRDNAELYRRHFADVTLPNLKSTKGFRGYEVLERTERDKIEFMVITRWDNMDAIRAFAGIMPDKAVIEPEARAFLVECEDYVTHYIRVAEEFQ
jgi:heme-degrading monooxygenase HmoA